MGTHIGRIEAENLKGRTFAYDLTQRVAIIGPNWTNKTTIIDAIRLAIIGFLPEIGKLPKATWELSSGPEMSVDVKFSNDEFIEREFWLDGTSVKTTRSASIEDPDFLVDRLPWLNTEQYFGMTDTQRTNYVFECIQLPSTYTKEAIIAEAHRMSFDSGHTEPVEKAKEAFINCLTECFAPGTTVQEALSEAVSVFKERFSHWNARCKETVGAVRLLTELKNREKDFSAVTVADLDRDIATAAKEVSQLTEEKGALTTAKAEAERNKAHIKRLEQFLAADVIDYGHRIARLEAEKKERLASRKDVPEVATVTAVELTRQLRDAEGELSKAKHALGLLQSKQQELVKATACPYCKSDGEAWKSVLFVEMEEQATNLKTTIGTLENAIVTLKMRIEAAHEIEAARRFNADVDARVTAIDKEIAQNKADAEQQKAIDDERRAELAERQSRPTIEVEAGREKEIQAKLEAADMRLADMRRRRDAANALQQDLKRAAQAQIEHLEAKAKLEVCKAFGKMIADKRTQMIADVFEDLTATANDIIGRDLLKSPIALHDGTIGRWVGSKFVPHRVFSGTEKTLTYVSIAAALSGQSPLRVVLIDEGARMTPNVRDAVMLKLGEAIDRGIIDQVIIVIPSDILMTVPLNWQAIYTR